MNTCIETLLSHRSIRQFTQTPINDETLNTILSCGQQASSSSFLQCVSVIRVRQAEKRAALVVCAGGQDYVASAAEFLVFCVDFHRHSVLFPDAKLGMTEQTIIGAVDCGIMAQNCLIAAESCGLGGVYIGGLRNQPEAVSDILNLPHHVLPLFGLCLGYPAQSPEKKPRLPLSILVHEDEYQVFDEAKLVEYDAQMADYYVQRGSNQKSTTWSAQIMTILQKEARPYMRRFIQSKGFSLK